MPISCYRPAGAVPYPSAIWRAERVLQAEESVYDTFNAGQRRHRRSAAYGMVEARSSKVRSTKVCGRRRRHDGRNDPRRVAPCRRPRQRFSRDLERQSDVDFQERGCHFFLPEPDVHRRVLYQDAGRNRAAASEDPHIGYDVEKFARRAEELVKERFYPGCCSKNWDSAMPVRLTGITSSICFRHWKCAQDARPVLLHVITKKWF